MARNEEKALTLFNKWHTFKHNFHADAKNRKPLLASECQSLPDAEKWRRNIVKELKKKVALIQNANLGEHRIRELNDEINKHMGQKYYWEIRIRELGGGDYRRSKGTQYYEVEGKELPGAPGYKYFGAAKELPGVREMFAEEEEALQQRRKHRSRGDIYKNISPDYFGYRDDDDGVLVRLEGIQEEKHKKSIVEDFTELKKRTYTDIKRSGGVFGGDTMKKLQKREENSDEEDDEILFVDKIVAAHDQIKENNIGLLAGPLVAPSAEDIQASIVSDRKKRLLAELA